MLLVTFGNTSRFITFTTHFAKYCFTKPKSKLNMTDYKTLFIHNLLSPQQLRLNICICMQSDLDKLKDIHVFSTYVMTHTNLYYD